MIRKSIYAIERILPLIQQDAIVDLDGDLVKVGSIRMQTFKVHGISCVKCGITGSFFAKEKSIKDEKYHLNLYAVDDKGHDVLMTRDHIIPVKDNGSNGLNNMQTMCFRCNVEKGSLPIPVDVINIRSKNNILRRSVLSLRNKIKSDKDALEDLNAIIRFINKSSCNSISTHVIGTIPEGSNIRAFDTHNHNFIEIGNNVVIAHDTVEGTERRRSCKNFYVFNKNTRERLHIHMGEKV
jgi:hypothetical protein